MKHNPEDYMKLVYMVVNKLCIKNPNLYEIRDDLNSEGMVLLCEVCSVFEEDKVTFSTYCVNHLQNRLVNYVYRNEYRFQRLNKLEDMVTPESEDGVSLSWEEVVEGSVVDINRSLSGLPDYLQEFLMASSSNGVKETRELLKIGSKKYYELKQELMDYIDSLPLI